MNCAVWYHLHNLRSVKNTHGGVLLYNSPPLVFFTLFELCKWYQITRSISYKSLSSPAILPSNLNLISNIKTGKDPIFMLFFSKLSLVLQIFKFLENIGYLPSA